MFKARSCFFQGEQNKKGSNVQVEVGVEADEQVEVSEMYAPLA